MRVILTKRTRRMFIGGVIALTHLIPHWKRFEALLVPLIYNLHTSKSFSTFLSFYSSHLEFSLYHFFHIQVWTSIVLHCLTSFAAFFPNLWSVCLLTSHPVCLNDSAVNSSFLSMAKRSALGTALSMQWMPSEGLLSDGHKQSQVELDGN